MFPSPLLPSCTYGWYFFVKKVEIFWQNDRWCAPAHQLPSSDSHRRFSFPKSAVISSEDISRFSPIWSLLGRPSSQFVTPSSRWPVSLLWLFSKGPAKEWTNLRALDRDFLAAGCLTLLSELSQRYIEKVLVGGSLALLLKLVLWNEVIIFELGQVAQV